MTRFWTCRKCRSRHPRIKQKCPCGARRPSRKTAAQKALAEQYEVWTTRFGDRCNICGVGASGRRRLDRDHDHRTGKSRGILCSRCNRALTPTVTVEWMEKAIVYLKRAV